MMMDKKQYLYDVLIDLLDRVGAADLSQRGEPYLIALDDSWLIAIHALAGRKVLVAPRNCMAVDTDPFTFYVWYNGWLAGEIALNSGWIADGEAANLESLQEALS